MKNQQLLTAKYRTATRKDTVVWRQAQSIITDVAVQIGALIDGVCGDFREASVPFERIKSWTIRFSWSESANAGNHFGLMRIAVSRTDGLVKIKATPLDSPDKKLMFERAIPVWELNSQKLGQVLMDAHAWTIRMFTPMPCQMATAESSAGDEETLWSGIKSLAVTPPAQLSVQL